MQLVLEELKEKWESRHPNEKLDLKTDKKEVFGYNVHDLSR